MGDASSVASESDEGDDSISGVAALYFLLFHEPSEGHMMESRMVWMKGIKRAKIG
jgi:hypothetical protein